MTYILKSPPSKELVDQILEETRELRKEADMGAIC